MIDKTAWQENVQIQIKKKFKCGNDFKIEWDESGVPKYVHHFPFGEMSVNPMDRDEKLKRFLELITKLFHSDKNSWLHPDKKISFEKRKEFRDGHDVSTFKLDTSYLTNGEKIPIVMGDATIRMDDAECYIASFNSFRFNIDIPNPIIGEQGSVGIVLAELKNYKSKINLKRKVILIRDGIPELFWEIKVTFVLKKRFEKDDRYGTRGRFLFYINAANGEIAKKFEDVRRRTQQREIRGLGTYSGLLHRLDTQSSSGVAGNDILLCDAASIPGKRICVVNSEWKSVPCRYYLKDDQIIRARAYEIHKVGPEIDCLKYTTEVFRYFLEKHGRVGYSDREKDIILEAHFGSKFGMTDTYWDTNSVKLSDGGVMEHYEYSVFGPFTSLDIMAHEWMHAIIDDDSELINYGEPGALTEALCDAFAFFICEWFREKSLRHMRKTNQRKWELGFENRVPYGVYGVRNLMNPARGLDYRDLITQGKDQLDLILMGCQPETMEFFYDRSDRDNGGVHANSGIINKLTSLLIVGGEYNGVNIGSAIDLPVIEKLYYHAQVHLSSNSKFIEFKNWLIISVDSAIFSDDMRSDEMSLGEYRSSLKRKIEKAFSAVGIKE